MKALEPICLVTSIAFSSKIKPSQVNGLLSEKAVGGIQ